jgi:hypothetical protein
LRSLRRRFGDLNAIPPLSFTNCKLADPARENNQFSIGQDWLNIRLLFDRLKPVAPVHTGIILACKELAMSSRQDENPPFETGMPELSTPERESASGSDPAMLRELQFASDTVFRLATRTHSAVARNDAAAAEQARAALERQLAQTTSLIDELLFGSTDPLTKH